MSNQDQQLDTIRVAIASDLHVHTESGDNSPSHLRVGADEANSMQHPITALKRLIEKETLRADVLLCPGDLGDKANPTGIQYAWRQLHDIKVSLGSQEILATVGNHDVDSRSVHNDFDPRGFLQSLRPLFPIDAESSYDRYWSRHFVLVERELFRVVLLNSSAFHGYEKEYAHGRISSHTLNALRETLVASSSKPVNILMCHHHPLQHSEKDLGEDDVMKGGQELLDLIGNGDFGEWLVVHGHKHHPKLTYAAGSGAVTPIVFAAGSLCANLFKGIQGSARNQFYLIEFPIGDIRSLGLVGKFRAWDWILGLGWENAGLGSGLPARGAFGHRERPAKLALDVNRAFEEPTITWEEIIRRCPQLNYLLPSDLARTLNELRTTYQMLVLDSDGIPFRLERQG